MVTTYTVGTGMSYATIQGAIDDIPGDLTGTGEHVVEVYATALNRYDELVDAQTGFTNASATDFVHITAMLNHNGLPATGIIIRENQGLVPTNVILGDYTFFEGFCVTRQQPSGAFPVLMGISVDGNYCRVSRCLVYGILGACIDVFGISTLAEVTEGSAQVDNTIVWNIFNGGPA